MGRRAGTPPPRPGAQQLLKPPFVLNQTVGVLLRSTPARLTSAVNVSARYFPFTLCFSGGRGGKPEVSYLSSRNFRGTWEPQNQGSGGQQLEGLPRTMSPVVFKAVFTAV